MNKDSRGDAEFDIGNPDLLVDHQRGNLDCWEGNVRVMLRRPEPEGYPDSWEWRKWADDQERGRLELRTIGALRILWDRAEAADELREALRDAVGSFFTPCHPGRPAFKAMVEKTRVERWRALAYKESPWESGFRVVVDPLRHVFAIDPPPSPTLPAPKRMCFRGMCDTASPGICAGCACCCPCHEAAA